MFKSFDGVLQVFCDQQRQIIFLKFIRFGANKSPALAKEPVEFFDTESDAAALIDDEERIDSERLSIRQSTARPIV